MLLINHQHVNRLLPMDECTSVVEKALKTLAKGDGINPLRPVMWLPGKKGALGMMPSYLADPGIMAAKIISVFPGNLGTEFESHQGVVLLFEVENGQLIAQVDGSEITAIRTAAASAVATRALANHDPCALAILGSGVQAGTHLEAMSLVADIQEARIFSPDEGRVREFVEKQNPRFEFDVRAAKTAREACIGAGILCTTTSSMEPVLLGEWLEPGSHINAVGACFPAARELDTAAVKASRMFVDRMESALNEAGDFIIPKERGEILESHILGELGDVLIGKMQGRTSKEEITLFKSLGIGFEDLACAHHIYTRAVAEGVGSVVDMGGKRR